MHHCYFINLECNCLVSIWRPLVIGPPTKQCIYVTKCYIIVIDTLLTSAPLDWSIGWRSDIYDSWRWG